MIDYAKHLPNIKQSQQHNEQLSRHIKVDNWNFPAVKHEPLQ